MEPVWIGLLVCFSHLFPASLGFTIILPDSPSNLINTPQTGYTMNMDKAHTDPEEQRAVYEIMTATGNGWASSIPDVCKGRWHGIECMPDQSKVLHVVSLSFGALSDDTAFPTCDNSSFISPAIIHLPHLKRIFFYQCCKGNPQPIPNFIGLLNNSLESLVLRENGHVGNIPPELGNLAKLHTLDLHGNNINSAIPTELGGLIRLQLLDLSKNMLVGQIPTSFESLTNINILDLNHNLLSGPISDQLRGLNSLRKLDLSSNQLSGAVPALLGHLRSLVLLDLSHNSLSGRLPDSLGDLKLLQALILQGNSIDGPIPEAIGGLQELMIMVLSNAGLKGPIPGTLGSLTKLRVLYLDGNRLNGSIPVSLGKMNHLSELKVNGNLLTGPVPFGREFMWRLGRRLKLADNPGLCYQPIDAGEEMDSSFLSGIKYCSEHKATGHVSTKTAPPIASQRPDISPDSAKHPEVSLAHLKSSSWPILINILEPLLLLTILLLHC
ncbi:hypothetical protein SUGI_0088920 [Cryptomeria japonica]|uniref:protein TOO MANY MOUTHS n=1 Tax=Cryptomeria japonica TaxID=3369 RepID=UPI0024089822|nr:protein TOO MANY MOUTHS [Cryptomeria japonica]GLJ08446.1 hypothetical protein SUGI_0088920 [Cryptomeria japonica]